MTERLIQFLLVEDDDDHAFLIKRTLEKNRIQNALVRVSDGQEAIDYLRAEGEFKDRVLPDIILLDLNLPKIDGIEVLRIIKSDGELKHIPVVMLTTSDAEIDRAKAYGYHVNSYLVKPLDFPQFRQMINDLGYYWGVWNKPLSSSQEDK